MRVCKFPECARTDIHAFGYCHKHYTRLRRHGDPSIVTKRKYDKVYIEVNTAAYTMCDEFPKRLRSLREDAEMARAALARRAGCSERSIRNWELGANEPNLVGLIKLALALGISLNRLVGLSADRKMDYVSGLKDRSIEDL